MPTRSQTRRLREVERHYEALFPTMTRFDLQAPPPESSSADDLPSDWMGELLGQGASSTLVLGFYTLDGIRHGLRVYGFMDALTRRGYPDAHVTVDLTDPWRHVLRIYANQDCDPHELLVDLRLRLAERAKGDVFAATHPKGLDGWLVAEWLVLQNPRASFDARRGIVPLPGQRFPGLGLGAEMMALLERIATRLGKRGILAHPSWVHNAVMYRPRFRFVDPVIQGRFDALRRDTANLTLAEFSWAVELGCVEDVNAGTAWQWTGDEMVLPLTDPDRSPMSGDAWREARAAARDAAVFTVDLAALAQRLAEQGAETPDEPIPTPEELRRYGMAPNIRGILVPHDLSESASAALPVAATLATAFGASVHLGHVLRLAMPSMPMSGSGDATEPPAGLLAVAEALRATVDDVHVFGRKGVPATELLRAADVCGYDLIVMTRGSVNPLLGLIGGATTDRMIREARTPVVVVPRALGDAAWNVKRVLYPVDWSQASMACVPLVAALADVLGAELDVMHIVQLPPGVPMPAVTRHPGETFLDAGAMDALFDNPIDRFVDRLDRLAPESTFLMLNQTDAARAILDQAAQSDASLIVMATHGSSLMQRLLIGSTTARVLEQTKIPVMVVPPDMWSTT